jgi:hypothetical protein
VIRQSKARDMKNAMHVRTSATIAACIALSLLGWIGHAAGQTFSSGSSGADGAFAPSCSPTPCTVVKDLNEKPDSVYHYTTVNIPSGVTVKYTPNAANTPVTILATGAVSIAGIVNLNGSDAQANNIFSVGPTNIGGRGGPGGFSGGDGGSGISGGSGARRERRGGHAAARLGSRAQAVRHPGRVPAAPAPR